MEIKVKDVWGETERTLKECDSKESPQGASRAELSERANQYARAKGDDCLCQRTQPGTPVGEHIYVFCGCDLAEAYIAGAIAKLK